MLSMSVCLSVGLCVCVSFREHVSVAARPNFTKFSTPVALCYLLPVSWTVYFSIIGPMANVYVALVVG